MAVLATFARMYVEHLDDAVDALDASGVRGVRLRFGHPSGLELALVGEVLVVAGPAEVVEPFRDTAVTVVVDDLDATLVEAAGRGATLVRGPAEQVVGRNATVRFPGGPVVEFVEWNAATAAAAAGQPMAVPNSRPIA